LIAINLPEEEEAVRYDCMECGRTESVLIVENRGYCLTPGCIRNEPIQFVYVPYWKKPKTSRANREIFLNM
jgi:hypothetical protein